MEQVQALDPSLPWTGLSLVLTDHAGITALHGRFLHQHTTTDVISFAYPPAPPAEPGATGEVIVNVEQALEIGPKYQGAAWELALYIAHGCHHLSGANDDTPARKKAMRTIEEQWLRTPEASAWISKLILNRPT